MHIFYFSNTLGL